MLAQGRQASQREQPAEQYPERERYNGTRPNVNFMGRFLIGLEFIQVQNS